MSPYVKNVMPMKDYRLKIDFDNGETGVFDCKPYLNKGVFKELKDESYFSMVRSGHGGTVYWPNEQDFCPDTIYELSVKDSHGN